MRGTGFLLSICTGTYSSLGLISSQMRSDTGSYPDLRSHIPSSVTVQPPVRGLSMAHYLLLSCEDHYARLYLVV